MNGSDGRNLTHLSSLDGLRGVAAAVVVLHHVLLLSPGLASAYLSPGEIEPGTVEWWVTLTPLHVLWAGGEAVRIFFVLSGFVLVLPFLDGRAVRWGRWYPQRLARLYLPTWAAVGCAVAFMLLIPRTSDSGSSWWLNRHDVPLEFETVSAPLLLVSGHVGYLLSPLWSLRWEVIFSVAFPAYLWWARRVTRWPLAQGLVLVLVAVVGQAAGREALQFLPLFGFGVLLAVHRRAVARTAARVPGWFWWVIGATTLAAIPAQRYRYAGGLDERGRWVDLAAATSFYALSIVGCVLVLVLALHWETLVRGLQTRVMVWLGSRSFALYLSHEIVVVSAGNAAGPGRHVLAGVVALVLAGPVAELFFRVFERPSHRLARRIGGQHEVKPAVSQVPGSTGSPQPRGRSLARR